MAGPDDRTEPPRLVGYESWLYRMPRPGGLGDLFVSVPLPGLASRPDQPSDRWLIALGDLSGRGEAAARQKAMLEEEVGRLSRIPTDPASILRELDRYVPSDGDRFAMMQVAFIDGQRHEMALGNAGSVPPLIRRAGGRVEAIGEDVAGMPLGVVAGQAYEAVTVSLRPGDVVVLFSDGVMAASDESGHVDDGHALRLAVAQAPEGAGSVGEAVVDSLRRFVAGSPQADDITILCLGRSA